MVVMQSIILTLYECLVTHCAQSRERMAMKASKQANEPHQGRLGDATADILETVHRTAAGLHQAKLLEKQAMQVFDELCWHNRHVSGGADIRR